MDRQPLFLTLAGRRVAVVGNGPIAARRVGALLSAGAEVVLFADQPCAEFLVLDGR
ncbi:NAD(P)-dependent oxidoreductase, partial [Rhodoblastus acidophilus]